jgi:hypothetical protein
MYFYLRMHPPSPPSGPSFGAAQRSSQPSRSCCFPGAPGAPGEGGLPPDRVRYVRDREVSHGQLALLALILKFSNFRAKITRWRRLGEGGIHSSLVLPSSALCFPPPPPDVEVLVPMWRLALSRRLAPLLALGAAPLASSPPVPALAMIDIRRRWIVGCHEPLKAPVEFAEQEGCPASTIRRPSLDV